MKTKQNPAEVVIIRRKKKRLAAADSTSHSSAVQLLGRFDHESKSAVVLLAGEVAE